VELSDVTAEPTQTCVDCNISFTADVDPAGQTACLQWKKKYRADSGSSWGAWTSAGSGSPVVLNTSTSGQYMYRACIGEPNNNCCEESAVVTVAEVNGVTPGVDYQNVYTNVTFTASTLPAGYGSLVQWSGGGTPATGSGQTFVTQWDTHGVKTVTATCCNSSKTGQVTILAVKSIEIWYDANDPNAWADVTDASIVLLQGTRYMYRAWPDPPGPSWPSPPQWSGAASGPGIWKLVTFGYAGSTSLTARASAPSAGKTVLIDVVLLYVDEISFIDNAAGQEHDIYGVTDPIWKDVNNPDDPASYTMAKKVKIEARFNASEDLTYPTDVNMDGRADDMNSNTYLFTADTKTFQTWPSPETSHVLDNDLPNTIGQTDMDFTWWYEVPSSGSGTHSMGTTGPHDIYRVFGDPACSNVYYTKSNIEDAMSMAPGKSGEANIASEANDNVGDGIYSGCICFGGFQKNFDAAMGDYPSTGSKGMCCCRAKGLDCVLQVLGIGPYTQDFVNEKSEPNPGRSVYYQDCSTCGVRVWRKYWDGFWNNWEGVVKAGGTGSTCYAPAEGSISIDEGTYSQFDNKIAVDCGYYWQNGPLFTDQCTHYGAP
jgi:hypothetical protein